MAIEHKIRTNRKDGYRHVKLTPLRAIRFQCIECMNFQAKLVEGCTASHCPLYPFRLGKQ